MKQGGSNGSACELPYASPKWVFQEPTSIIGKEEQEQLSDWISKEYLDVS